MAKRYYQDKEYKPGGDYPMIKAMEAMQLRLDLERARREEVEALLDKQTVSLHEKATEITEAFIEEKIIESTLINFDQVYKIVYEVLRQG